MKLLQFQKRLDKAISEIAMAGGDILESELSIEAITDEGDIYYEENFDFFIDGNNDIGLSPVNK